MHQDYHPARINCKDEPPQVGQRLTSLLSQERTWAFHGEALSAYRTLCKSGISGIGSENSAKIGGGTCSIPLGRQQSERGGIKTKRNRPTPLGRRHPTLCRKATSTQSQQPPNCWATPRVSLIPQCRSHGARLAAVLKDHPPVRPTGAFWPLFRPLRGLAPTAACPLRRYLAASPLG